MKHNSEIAKDWRGCIITIAIMGSLFFGGPFLAWGDIVPEARVIAGHVLFAIIGIFIITLVLDSYLVVVETEWIRRGLIGRYPMNWNDIDKVEAGIGVTFFSGERRITIYPFVFKNESEFLAVVNERLKGRLTFSARPV